MANTLILGTATGYNAAQMAPFLLSLRETGYKGDVALCVSYSDLNANDGAIMTSWGATLEPFDTWRFMPIDIQLSRYLKYYEFLSSRRYDYILLTDTRDVIFQKDPFEVDMSRNLYCFLEKDGMGIGDCISNSQWVKAGFGIKKLNELYNKPISCSGTTMGSYNGIMQYLTAVIQATGLLDSAALKVKGMDQGIHNVLIHDNILKDFVLMENQKHINTMCYVPKEDISLSPEGIVVNKDGSVSNIIHQYTYSPHDELCAQLIKRYAPRPV